MPLVGFSARVLLISNLAAGSDRINFYKGFFLFGLTILFTDLLGAKQI